MTPGSRSARHDTRVRILRPHPDAGTGQAMITFDDVTFTYPDAERPTLARVSAPPPRGRPVPGDRLDRHRASRRLLGAINGLVPHFTGGHAGGPGRSSTAGTPPGTVRATWPTSSATSARTRCAASSPTPSRTRSPTAWSSWASTRSAMRKRVEETLDLMGIADLRRRPLTGAVRRPAAAGGDRRGAGRPAAGAGARRAHLGARSDRRPGRAGGHHHPGPRSRADRRARRAPPRAGHAGRRLR